MLCNVYISFELSIAVISCGCCSAGSLSVCVEFVSFSGASSIHCPPMVAEGELLLWEEDRYKRMAMKDRIATSKAPNETPIPIPISADRPRPTGGADENVGMAVKVDVEADIEVVG